MKRILFTLILIFSIAIFGADYEKAIEKDRKETIKLLENLSKTKNSQQTIIASVFTADEMLKNLKKYNRRFDINAVVLVYPDMNILNKNLKTLSKSFKNIVIFSIANDTNDKYLKNRTTKKLKDLKMINKIKEVGNITVIESKIDKKDLPLIIPESLKVVKTNKIMSKYILN